MTLALMILKAIPALILVFIVWPFTLGAGLGLKKNLDRYIIGFTTVQALYFIIYIPAIVFSWSSRTLTYTAAGVITVVGLTGALLQYFKTIDRKDFLALNKPNFSYLKNPFFIGALLIVGYEMLIYATKEPWIYGDDVTYMRLVSRFVDTNAIYTKDWAGQTTPTTLHEVGYKYVFTSYYPFLGMISLLTSLHPLILCKTVIPLIYLPIHYLIIWRIGEHLFSFEEDVEKRIEKQSFFIFIYATLIEFGQISYYTISRRVTIWIYNSKSDCFCLLLIPLFFYTYVLLTEKLSVELFRGDKHLVFRQFVIVIIAIACNSSSLMGVLLSTIVMMTWYVIVAIRTRKISILLAGLWTFVPQLITCIILMSFIGFHLPFEWI